MTAAFIFFALPCFSGGALDALTLFTLSTDLGFFFGALAIFRLALARFNEGEGAGIAFFIGERAEHDA